MAKRVLDCFETGVGRVTTEHLIPSPFGGATASERRRALIALVNHMRASDQVRAITTLSYRN
jgi:hypothetical protein